MIQFLPSFRCATDDSFDDVVHSVSRLQLMRAFSSYSGDQKSISACRTTEGRVFQLARKRSEARFERRVRGMLMVLPVIVVLCLGW